ncbi:unnamed protein product [Phytophthora lilii]|uniref:Unnamed protein product n=1 Tax=Phytophthora lilii TaxID=2077276 RepID=A0A9W6X999_9STRA|nr:unnamed protein product [Phytophthora lilii]
MKFGGTRGDDPNAALITPHLAPITERSVSFEDSADGSNAKDEMEDYEDLEEKAPALAVVTPDTPEDAILSAGRSGGSRSLSQNLAGPEPTYDDYDSDAEDSKSPTSEWIQLFEPTPIRQAVWADLSHELAWPVTSTSLDQSVKETVTFLKAMGLQATSRPSPSNLESWPPAEAGAELSKWQKRLRGAFGATAFNMGRRPTPHSANETTDPSKVPLPKTPTKTAEDFRGRKAPTAVFSATGERSPYFQDSHMVTPKSVNHNEHVRTTADNSGDLSGDLSAVVRTCSLWLTDFVTSRSSGRGSRRRFPLSNDSSDDDDDSNEFTGDGGAQMNEYLRQIREVTETERQNVTPRIEVETHRPLGQIKAFSGLRNKSENSMQWLRAFVYEMRGTRASPDE